MSFFISFSLSLYLSLSVSLFLCVSLSVSLCLSTSLPLSFSLYFSLTFYSFLASSTFVHFPNDPGFSLIRCRITKLSNRPIQNQIINDIIGEWKRQRNPIGLRIKTSILFGILLPKMRREETTASQENDRLPYTSYFPILMLVDF